MGKRLVRNIDAQDVQDTALELVNRLRVFPFRILNCPRIDAKERESGWVAGTVCHRVFYWFVFSGLMGQRLVRNIDAQDASPLAFDSISCRVCLR
jgi:hypothetical protein